MWNLSRFLPTFLLRPEMNQFYSTFECFDGFEQLDWLTVFYSLCKWYRNFFDFRYQIIDKNGRPGETHADGGRSRGGDDVRHVPEVSACFTIMQIHAITQDVERMPAKVHCHIVQGGRSVQGRVCLSWSMRRQVSSALICINEGTVDISTCTINWAKNWRRCLNQMRRPCRRLEDSAIFDHFIT